MRSTLTIALFAILVGASSAATAAPLRVASLPKGSISKTPDLSERPERIGAQEKVDGIHPALPPEKHRQHQPQGSRYVTIYGHADDAKEHALNGFSQAQHEEATACFSTADHWRMQNGPQEWPMSQAARASVHGVLPGSAAAQQYSGNNHGGVHALHVERLVIDGKDRATLRFTDAWVDPVSLGVRAISSGSIALEKVAEGPSGVGVFAARDESGDAIHFVVHTPSLSERERNLLGRHMMLMRGGEMSSSDCGHARLTLRTAPGTGERGSVHLQLLLPSLEGEQAQKERSAVAPTSLPAKLARALVTGQAEPPQPQEIRVRSLVIHSSVSQAASDAQPLGSVSFGWKGRERRMQTF